MSNDVNTGSSKIAGTRAGIHFEEEVLCVLNSGSQGFVNYCAYRTNVEGRELFVKALRLGLMSELKALGWSFDREGLWPFANLFSARGREACKGRGNPKRS